MRHLKVVPNTSPMWKTVDNIKQLAIVGEQFAMMDTIGVDKEGALQALMNAIQLEAVKIEDYLDE